MARLPEGSNLLAQTKQFKGLSLRRVMEDNPQTLRELKNLRVTADHILQARGGIQKPKSIGGTYDASSPMVTGSATSKAVGVAELYSIRPVVMTKTAGGTFSEDLSNLCWWQAFTAAAVNEELWIISPGGRFSSFTLNVGRAAANLTITWYYTSPSGDQVLASVTEQFTATGERIISFAPPTSPTWGGVTKNGYFGWAVFGRITAVGGGPVIPRFCQTRISGDFPSRRVLVGASSDTGASATSTKLWRYAPSVTSQTRYQNVDNGAGTGLRSGFDAPVRMATNDGVLYAVNGEFMRRYQGDPALNGDIGFTKPSATGLANAKYAVAGNLIGVYIYGVSYGYGPNGEWGESPIQFCTTSVNPTGIGERAQVSFPTEVATLKSGIVDVIYVYRSVDLTGCDQNTYSAQPFFRHAAVTRQDTDGLFPTLAVGPYAGQLGFEDNSQPRPFPTPQADLRDRTPPVGCRFAVFSKGRLVIGRGRDHAARVWPSFIGEYEAYDQSSDGYVDFTRQDGAELTGMVEFQDYVLCFTETGTFALVNLDQDDWSMITVHPEIGCVAPDSIAVGYGLVFWLSRNGVWMWDGENPPVPIGYPVRIENASRLIHGMSRGIVYDYGYELELIPWDRGLNDTSVQWPSAVYASLFTKYFFSLRDKQWGTTELNNAVGSYLQPLGVVYWPHFTSWEGRRAPVYGRFRTGASGTDLDLYLGEADMDDDGSSIQLAFTMPYGPNDVFLYRPDVWEVNTKGVTTVAMAITTVDALGEAPTLQTAALRSDTSDVYDVYQGKFGNPGEGCGALEMRMTGLVDQAAADRQSFIYAAHLFGRRVNRRLR